MTINLATALNRLASCPTFVDKLFIQKLCRANNKTKDGIAHTVQIIGEAEIIYSAPEFSDYILKVGFTLERTTYPLKPDTDAEHKLYGIYFLPFANEPFYVSGTKGEAKQMLPEMNLNTVFVDGVEVFTQSSIQTVMFFKCPTVYEAILNKLRNMELI